MIALALLTALAGRPPIVVAPGSAVPTLAAALRRARDGDTIVVRPGTYRDTTIVVDRAVTIVGDGFPVLDGSDTHAIMVVAADDVTIRGLEFRNVGVSYTEDRAALRLAGVHDCRVEGNRLDRAFFGIYLARVDGCVVAHNVIRGTGAGQSANASAIHLYASRNVQVRDNVISGHRDGIYLEFTRRAEIDGNASVGNTRYGLHFMYSDSCDYRGNTFRDNASGVAVMYSHRVTMTGNTFSGARGSAAYGLLLKELRDSDVRDNAFDGNTVGTYVEGSDRITFEGNRWTGNGWGIRLMADADETSFEANRFAGNTFDVATNSRATRATFHGNYWDRYAGYDLDRDGYGDVPFPPVRLFALAVEQHPAALILARSFFMDLLDTAERVLPVLTPAELADDHPRMRWTP
jgi:nitrous oxidase accessory protein